MSIKCMWVDMVAIGCGQPKEIFNQAEIESLANTIVECGGLVRPLLVKATSSLTYEVVANHLEYWAAVRAKEIDSSLETVNAFIATDDNIDKLLKQFAPSVASPKQVEVVAVPVIQQSAPVSDRQATLDRISAAKAAANSRRRK